MSKFTVGLAFGGNREYSINGVKYVVGSRFEKRNSITERLERCVTSDFTHLTSADRTDRIDTDYVCSAAGEEEICSRK